MVYKIDLILVNTPQPILDPAIIIIIAALISKNGKLVVGGGIRIQVFSLFTVLQSNFTKTHKHWPLSRMKNISSGLYFPIFCENMDFSG